MRVNQSKTKVGKKGKKVSPFVKPMDNKVVKKKKVSKASAALSSSTTREVEKIRKAQVICQ